MKLKDVLGALGRQWILTLVCLMMTAGLGIGAARLVPQRYTATAHVLLMPPTASVAVDQNPYMQLGGLYGAVEMVGVAVSDQATAEEIKGISSKAEVVVRQDPLSSAPLLLVTVVDSDEARSLRIVDLMLAKVASRLDLLQASIDIRAPNRVTSLVLTKDLEAKPTGLDQVRAIIVAIAAGLLFTTVCAAFLDGVRSRWRARRLKLKGSGQAKRARDRGLSTSAPTADGGPTPVAREPRYARTPTPVAKEPRYPRARTRKMRIVGGRRGRYMRTSEHR